MDYWEVWIIGKYGLLGMDYWEVWIIGNGTCVYIMAATIFHSTVQLHSFGPWRKINRAKYTHCASSSIVYLFSEYPVFLKCNGVCVFVGKV